jgi:hypothetical protein
MIRRKLTRIEVTLEDTKELDDLIVKNSLSGIASAGITLQTINNSSVSTPAQPEYVTVPNSSRINREIVKNSVLQKQLIQIGKEFASGTNIALESTSPTLVAAVVAAAAAAATTTLAGQSIESANIAPASANLLQNTETDSQSTSYNPQPYNPSNRFQLNHDPADNS